VRHREADASAAQQLRADLDGGDPVVAHPEHGPTLDLGAADELEHRRGHAHDAVGASLRSSPPMRASLSRASAAASLG
jgi:hypothetical protein